MTVRVGARGGPGRSGVRKLRRPVASAAAPSFNPLTGWTTDPVHGVWASDPLWTPPADGGAVSSWRNGGSVGGNLVQATGSARPVYDAVNPLYNGAATVYFNADDAVGVDIADLPHPVWFVVVGACAVDGASRRIVGGVPSMGITTGGAWVVQSNLAVTAGTATADPHLWIGKINGASSSLTIDGASVASGNTGSTELTFLSVGAYNNGSGTYSNFSVGDVALALVFTTDPTTQPEWSAFSTWVEDTYGVPLPLRPPADDHIVLTGQSLAIGPTDIQTAAAPYPDNVFRARTSGQLIPMFAQTYETPALALAASVHAGRGSGTVSMAVSALDGAVYTSIKKGTATYANAIAVCANTVDTVTAVHVVHGEGDTRFATARATYQGYLDEWQLDYDTDIKTTTGQVSDVHMILAQTCSWPAYVVLSGVDHASIGLAQLDAHRDNAAITLACPAYQLAGNADGIHLTGAGSHHLGELMARAHLAVVDGAGWNPLMPLSVVRTGAVIVVEFDVPVAPLVIDTTTVSAQTHYGFTYHDDTATAAVSSVALGGNGTSVEITLTATPSGTNPHVGYGYTSTKFGNLRDSETAVSTLDATPLANWCVHFYEPVTT